VSETNVELARRGWAAAMRGDLDEIAALLDPEVKWHAGDPNAEGSCQNRAQALHWMERARTHRPLPELIEVNDAGDKVVLVLRPQSAPGEEPALTANVSTIRDGKVVEMVHFDRVEDALRAAGLDP
jgi:ketosteroid isomerase-like protein